MFHTHMGKKHFCLHLHSKEIIKNSQIKAISGQNSS